MMQSMPPSPGSGGYTFPENPEQSCAHTLPIWSAAIDPRVLSVRARLRGQHDRELPFDPRHPAIRILCGNGCDHVLIQNGGHAIRIDIVEGTLGAAPFFLDAIIGVVPHIDVPLRTALLLRDFLAGRLTPCRRHDRCARLLPALHAWDAHGAGASLRDVADLLLGPGDWPGAGEYRKSRARRLLAQGQRMIAAGPATILGMSFGCSSKSAAQGSWQKYLSGTDM